MNDALRLGVNNGDELAQDGDRWMRVVVAVVDLNSKWSVKAERRRRYNNNNNNGNYVILTWKVTMLQLQSQNELFDAI